MPSNFPLDVFNCDVIDWKIIMQNVAISAYHRKKLESLGLSLSKKKLLIYTLNFMPNTVGRKGGLTKFSKLATYRKPNPWLIKQIIGNFPIFFPQCIHLKINFQA